MEVKRHLGVKIGDPPRPDGMEDAQEKKCDALANVGRRYKGDRPRAKG